MNNSKFRLASAVALQTTQLVVEAKDQERDVSVLNRLALAARAVVSSPDADDQGDGVEETSRLIYALTCLEFVRQGGQGPIDVDGARSTLELMGRV